MESSGIKLDDADGLAHYGEMYRYHDGALTRHFIVYSSFLGVIVIALSSLHGGISFSTAMIAWLFIFAGLYSTERILKRLSSIIEHYKEILGPSEEGRVIFEHLQPNIPTSVSMVVLLRTFALAASFAVAANISDWSPLNDAFEKEAIDNAIDNS